MKSLLAFSFFLAASVVAQDVEYVHSILYSV